MAGGGGGMLITSHVSMLPTHLLPIPIHPLPPSLSTYSLPLIQSITTVSTRQIIRTKYQIQKYKYKYFLCSIFERSHKRNNSFSCPSTSEKAVNQKQLYQQRIEQVTILFSVLFKEQSCKMSQIWQIYLSKNIGRLG